MKTVFLALSQSHNYSDVLHGKCLRALAERFRVIVLTPLIDQDAAQRGGFWQHPNVEYVKLPLAYEKPWMIFDKFIRVPLNREFDHLTYMRYFYQRPFWWPRKLLMRLRLFFPKRLFSIDRITRWEMRLAKPTPEFVELVRRYKPVLLITGTPGFKPFEAEMIHFAKHLGLKTIAIDINYDNLTSNAKLMRKTDYLAVWNDLMKGEAMMLHRYPPDRLFVVGSLRFDHYFTDERSPDFPSREQFLRSKGLDPAKKTIVFAGPTPWNYPPRREFVARLLRLKRQGILQGDPNVLVRIHPNDDIGLYRDYIGAAGVCFESPARPRSGRAGKPEMDEKDFLNLTATLKYADVVLNFASTVAMEACIFDRPVINVAFPDYRRIVYQYEYNKYIVDTKAVRLADSPEALAELINGYFRDPALDRAARQKLLDEFIPFRDGLSWQRTVDFLEILAARPAVGSMKTVLIPIYQAVEAKNILRTAVLDTLLKDHDIRVLCLTRNEERAAYYQKEISHPRLVYEPFYFAPGGFWERLFSALKFQFLRTATTDLRRRMRYEDSGNTFGYFASLSFNRLAARPRLRRLARFFDYRLVADPGFGSILEKYGPDVLFLAHLFDDAETAILREARRRNIPTVGFINSWDKLTARSTLRLLPDTLVVYNEIVKREALKHADMPEERIIISGVPQYDWHLNTPAIERQEFFRKKNLDPEKSLVLFAPMGREFSNSDWQVIDLLHSFLIERSAIPNVELLVRFQPNDFLDGAELSKRPWLKYDLPGVRFGSKRGGDWDMNFEELRHLSHTLAHTAVLVSYASSMSVDAAIFGKPVINLNFEVRVNQPRAKTPTFYYLTEHYKKALDSGGIRLVSSVEELLHWLKIYLANPEVDAAARERLVREQCFKIDGKSGERVAAVILKALCGPASGGAAKRPDYLNAKISRPVSSRIISRRCKASSAMERMG